MPVIIAHVDSGESGFTSTVQITVSQYLVHTSRICKLKVFEVTTLDYTVHVKKNRERERERSAPTK